jgi:hypothetical protein
MSLFKKMENLVVSTGAAFLGGLVLSGAAMAVTLPTGVPLQAGQTCAIHLYQSNSSSLLMAKTNIIGGSYRFRAYQALPINDVDIQLGGRFSGSNGQNTILTRNHLGLGYVVPAGRGGFAELRDAEYGQDAWLDVQLDVYDARGRLVCQTRQARTFPMQLAYGSMRRAPAAPRYTAQVPENARAAQARLAASRAEQTDRMTPHSRLQASRGARLRQIRARRAERNRYRN